jgi:hypothetical protein
VTLEHVLQKFGFDLVNAPGLSVNQSLLELDLRFRVAELLSAFEMSLSRVQISQLACGTGCEEVSLGVGRPGVQTLFEVSARLCGIATL